MSENELLEWQGCVIEVDGDMFTAELSRDGRLELEADYSMSECGLSDVRTGDFIIVTPDSVRLVIFPPYTKKELDRIKVQAAEQAAKLGLLVDTGEDP